MNPCVSVETRLWRKNLPSEGGAPSNESGLRVSGRGGFKSQFPRISMQNMRKLDRRIPFCIFRIHKLSLSELSRGCGRSRN
jgi:hypothetical protein